MSDIERGKKNPAKKIALVGIMAASIECGKLALAFIPNVEVVSLLIALFSYVFGLPGVLAAAIFVCIEPLIWGFDVWIISYFIYWPTLGVLFLLLGKLKVRNRVTLTAIITLMTLLFGVLTTLVDIGLFSGYFDSFFYRFGVYYARGVVFYVVHIVSNAVIFILLFTPLKKRLEKIKISMRI